MSAAEISDKPKRESEEKVREQVPQGYGTRQREIEKVRETEIC